MDIVIKLNTSMRDNYAFYCHDASLSLSISKPVGVAHRLTDSIIRGVSYGTLIDVNNVIDLEHGCLKTEPSIKTEEQSTFRTSEISTNMEQVTEEKVIEEVKEEIIEEVAEIEEETEIKEEVKTTSSKNKNKSKNTTSK